MVRLIGKWCLIVAFWIATFLAGSWTKKCPDFKVNSMETKIKTSGDTLVVFSANKPFYFKDNRTYFLVYDGKDSITVWLRAGAFTISDK